MEAAALVNIANSYETPQSLRKPISRVCEKLRKYPWKKQSVIGKMLLRNVRESTTSSCFYEKPAKFILSYQYLSR